MLRLCPNGPVTELTFDLTDKKAGLLNVNLPFFAVLRTPMTDAQRHLVYEYLVQDPSLYCAIMMNDTSVVGIGENMCHSKPIMDWGAEASYYSTPGCYPDWRGKIKVGYKRTKVPYCDIPRIPEQIYIDQNGLCTLDNVNTFELRDAVEYTKADIFFQMMEEGYDWCYMSTHGPVFKKGGM